MLSIFKNSLAIGTILSSIFVITSKNPVVAVVCLICVFVFAAGYLILQNIIYIGLAYILVYVGAVAILFLFVVMMINIKLADILETGKQYTKSIPLAILILCLITFMIANILMDNNPQNILAYSYIFFLIINLFNFSLLKKIQTIKELNLDNVPFYTTIQPYLYDISFVEINQVEAIGIALYTYQASLLLICSIILLLAMVAPIFISRKAAPVTPILHLKHK